MAEHEQSRKAVDYFKVLEDQCWDLRCVAEPTGGDDADIAWHVVGHWMAQPQERVIGYGRTPQEAIKDAMRPRDHNGNLLDEDDDAARVVDPWPVREHRPSFQSRVRSWMKSCFGVVISADKVERNHRFLEEALELVQAGGCSREDCHQLVEYVYGRPVGKISQEVGGVRVTLAALCDANGINEDEAAEIELARVWTKIDTIREKQAAKPRGSALPVSPSYAPAQPDKAEVERVAKAIVLTAKRVGAYLPEGSCFPEFPEAMPHYDRWCEVAEAALATIPPHRDDGGLVEELNDNDLMDVLRKTQISPQMQKPFVVTRWKDGIDIDEPTQTLRNFARHVLAKAARAKAGA